MLRQRMLRQEKRKLTPSRQRMRKPKTPEPEITQAETPKPDKVKSGRRQVKLGFRSAEKKKAENKQAEILPSADELKAGMKLRLVAYTGQPSARKLGKMKR